MMMSLHIGYRFLKLMEFIEMHKYLKYMSEIIPL